jgi:hypothetical protein
MTTLSHAKQLHTEAGKLAQLMATSAPLTASIDNAIQIARENKITVSNIHFDLFGDPVGGVDGVFSALSEEQLNALPAVGSEEGKTGNLPYDKFEFKNAEGKAEKRAFWRMVAEQYPAGAHVQDKLEKLRVRQQVQNEYTELSDADAKKLKDDLNADFTALYSKLRIAVQCWFMMREVAEKLDGVVTVNYAQKPVIDPKTKRVTIGADKQPVYELDRTSPQIMEVTDATNPKAGKFFTMANFVRLNVELTLAGEANYGAFITSNKRGDADADSEDIEADEQVKIDSPLRFENGTIAFHHYLNAVKGNQPLFRGLIAYYTKSGCEDRVRTLVELTDMLALVAEHKDVKAIAEKLTVGAGGDKSALKAA